MIQPPQSFTPWRLLWCGTLLVVTALTSWGQSRESPAPTPIPERAVRPSQPPSGELAHLDPRKAGWVSEVVAEAIALRLGQLEKAVTTSREALISAVDQMMDPRLLGPAINREHWIRTFEDKDITVRRLKKAAGGAPTEGPLAAEKLGQLIMEGTSVGPASDTEAVERSMHFKIVGVTVSAQKSTTDVIVQYEATNRSSRLERNSRWTISWLPPRKRGELPRLSRIQVHHSEESILSRSGPLFRDESSLLIDSASGYWRQFAHPLSYWRERIDWRYTLESSSPYGLAVADVNGDGREDVYYCEAGGLPNRLFLQQEDGSVRESASLARLDYLEPTHGSLFLDLDNDGDQDVVFTSGRQVVFCENNGQGVFEQRQVRRSESMGRSLCAADFDQDGFLDVYVCGYYHQANDSTGLGRPLPYHDANNGVANILLRHTGDWNFREVTDQVGLNENNSRFSFAASWADYDRDGDQDLYVANDFGRNNLYRNDGGRFRDVAAEAGVEDLSAGMSVAWGDLNQDGFPDLYVSNMFSSAGNRVAYQRQYRAGDEARNLGNFRRHARGNSLFLNKGDGTFDDVSVEQGVTMGRWAWAAPFADLNNDGREDLIVANGFISSPDESGDL